MSDSKPPEGPATPPADQTRDVAAEEQEALRIEAQREADLLRKQRERE